jgi:hypothetical protein
MWLVYGLVGGLIWLLIASFFVSLAWNKVLSPIFSWKNLSYVNALLLVFTLALLCAPKHMAKHHMMHHGGGCMCGYMEHGENKDGGCPHHKEMMKKHEKGEPMQEEEE